MRRRLCGVVPALAGALAVGCGEGPTDPRIRAPSVVRLVSDAADYVGAGRTYEYSRANAVITVEASGGFLAVGIDGDERWGGAFQLPSGLNQLEPGTYTDLQRYPFHDPANGGLDWSGEGRGCNNLTGWFAVDSVGYDNGDLNAIDLRFEQHCEGAAAALHGTIHWWANDPTVPPGPVYPVPDHLWRPPPGATPPTGNYVYLASESGDWVGQGAQYSYTAAADTIAVTVTGGLLSVRVNRLEWTGDFQAMNTLSRLEPGYYPDVRRYPFHNPVKGGLSWSGQGRGCNTLLGWFAIDRVTYSGELLTAVELRFAQHCEGGTPALRGAVRWGG